MVGDCDHGNKQPCCINGGKYVGRAGGLLACQKRSTMNGLILVLTLLSEYFNCTVILLDLTVLPTLSLNTQKHIHTLGTLGTLTFWRRTFCFKF